MATGHAGPRLFPDDRRLVNGAAVRFIEALADIEKVSPADSTVVVVAHGGVTVDVLRTLLGDERVAAANPELILDGAPFGAIASLIIDNGRIAVGALPRTAHLAGTSPHRPA